MELITTLLSGPLTLTPSVPDPTNTFPAGGSGGAQLLPKYSTSPLWQGAVPLAPEFVRLGSVSLSPFGFHLITSIRSGSVAFHWTNRFSLVAVVEVIETPWAETCDAAMMNPQTVS